MPALPFNDEVNNVGHFKVLVFLLFFEAQNAREV